MKQRQLTRRGICFDTTPLIWGVRGDASRGDEHMVQITRDYIQHLTELRIAIVVPSPVVAEYLVGATDTQFRELEILKRGFEYPSFDARAAVLAAELQRGNIIREIHEDTGASKSSLRIDTQIIACAILSGAEEIITNNVREFTSLSRGRIPISTVPQTRRQASLGFPDVIPGVEED